MEAKTKEGEWNSWARSAELDLSHPRLFLAVSRLHNAVPSAAWPLDWVKVSHQHGGLSCDQTTLTGIFLTPRTGVEDKMRSLHARFDIGVVGMFGVSLKTLNEYAAALQETLGESCDETYRSFSEALYPIDIGEETLARLTENKLPENLDDLFAWGPGLSKTFGSVGRWKVYVIAENSD